ncbi:LINE-1 retrotransposable element ORF1 protein [Plecturocebus cupreus]
MELKNTTQELHEACTSLNSQIDQAEERITEVEDQLNEIKQEGKMTEKKGVPECEEENESKLENTLQDIIQENFPNLARQANIQVQEIQRTPQRYSSRRATPRHIIIRFTRVEMKEKMLRAAREKGRVTHKGKPIRLTADLSAETLQARREWGPTFNILKEKNFQPRISYPAKLSFISEGKIKFFVNQQVLRDYITTRPALEELLKEALHMDRNNQYQPFQKHTKRHHVLTLLPRLKCSSANMAHCSFDLLVGLELMGSSDPPTSASQNVGITGMSPCAQPNYIFKGSVLKDNIIARKISRVWWCTPVVPATWEAEAGESLDPWRQRLQLTKIMPLHSSLSDKTTREAEAGDSLEPRRWRLQRAEIVPLHSSLGDRHFGRPGWVDNSRSGVQDQPRQHDENPSLLKIQEISQARRMKEENDLNLEEGGCSELRSHHCTPAWETEKRDITTDSTNIKRIIMEFKKNKSTSSWAWWLIPVILALWEAEAGRSQGQEFKTSLVNITGKFPADASATLLAGLAVLPAPRRSTSQCGVYGTGCPFSWAPLVPSPQGEQQLEALRTENKHSRTQEGAALWGRGVH